MDGSRWQMEEFVISEQWKTDNFSFRISVVLQTMQQILLAQGFVKMFSYRSKSSREVK